MKKYLFVIILILKISFVYTQTITVNRPLIIKNYGNIVLMINHIDSLSLISINKITYNDFLKLDSERDNGWYNIPGYTKYQRKYYIGTQYDLGHLTPSHITSYNNQLNKISFNYNNQAPQKYSFNRGSWKKLELNVEYLIKNRKQNITIITGVVYLNYDYLPNSKIRIPTYFYKILIFEDKTYIAWLGNNITGIIQNTNILNIQKINNFNFNIKWEK